MMRSVDPIQAMQPLGAPVRPEPVKAQLEDKWMPIASQPGYERHTNGSVRAAYPAAPAAISVPVPSTQWVPRDNLARAIELANAQSGALFTLAFVASCA